MDTTDQSVSSIIAAFRESLREFKNFRERKRKLKKEGGQGRRGGVARGKEEDSSDDELRLSQSLRQGAVDVQREYDRNFRVLGDSYAVGDMTAHSSLGRTLRKLNTCLHTIISSLLSCGRNNLKVDYQYLTSVSDVSRQEALEALSQLSYRMSQSAISLRQQKEQEKRARHRHGDGKPRHKIPSSRSVTDVTERSRQKIPSSKSVTDITERSRHSSVSGDKKQPTVRKVHLKSASTPQLAMVRPKTHRRSSSSKSEVSTTPASSPKTSSLPPSSPVRPKHRRALSDQPYAFPPAAAIALAMSDTTPSPQFLTATVKQTTPPTPPQTLRRRQDKITPSVYTFQSASTRLGEIPEVKWSLPYDHEAMLRLNNEHGGRPWPPPPEPTKPRKGFFSLFKKSEMKTGEVAA